ncbi:MAG: stage VI sporulation protein D [Anaerobacillus sp.]|uniref:stage VI sporulation protein D n=1 Tax=Anaerobacillus sp. TaxID=1872506 RepID=UPI00391D8518
MTQDRSSKLSFSIEESVWLNKGQEVDEIVSLSLDPEITVQEHGEYVLIRGGLRLTGEYRSSGKITPEGEHESLASQVAYRSIEEVTLHEDGTGEIRHHFPIDVTIPQERIRSLDDIYVIVDSFDYDLPERGCIQLTADVSITGMSAGKSSKEVIEEVATQEVDRTFHFEAYNEEQVEKEVTSRADIPLNDEIPELVEEESITELIEEHQEEETVVQFPTEEVVARVDEEEAVEEVTVEEEVFSEGDEVEAYELLEEESRTEAVEVEAELSEEVTKEIKSPAVAFGVVKNPPKTEPVAEANEQPQAKEEGFSLAKSFTKERRQEVKQATQQQEVQELEDEVEAIESHEQQVEEVTTPREENALYLTKMLTKGDGEQFKKLKLCIIRENETLETIAARYEINQSTLIRVNRLNDANVEEGQILYIPVTQ